MERRKFRFKVPPELKSRKKEEKSYVEFKNLTDHLILLYWVDYESKPRFFGELKPINRSDVGLRILTFVTHPWLAVFGKKQATLNGKLYFFPPLPFWKDNSNGWLNSQWNVLQNVNIPAVKDNETEVSNNKDLQTYFEVLILEPACKDLKTLCLLRLLDVLNGRKHEDLQLPRTLRSELEKTKQHYFLYQ